MLQQEEGGPANQSPGEQHSNQLRVAEASRRVQQRQTARLRRQRCRHVGRGGRGGGAGGGGQRARGSARGEAGLDGDRSAAGLLTGGAPLLTRAAQDPLEGVSTRFGTHSLRGKEGVRS